MHGPDKVQEVRKILLQSRFPYQGIYVNYVATTKTIKVLLYLQFCFFHSIRLNFLFVSIRLSFLIVEIDIYRLLTLPFCSASPLINVVCCFCLFVFAMQVPNLSFGCRGIHLKRHSLQRLLSPMNTLPDSRQTEPRCFPY